MTGFTLALAEADPDDVDLLGGKGAGLARLVRLGLPVPAGYVVSTAACREYLAAGVLPAGLFDEILTRLGQLEASTGKTFGGGDDPLLVSVRSGAPVSMPGMMDTILDLGLTRESAVSLARLTGNPLFVADLVVRFHRMYAETVLGTLDVHDDVDRLAREVSAGEDVAEVVDRLWAAADGAVAEETEDVVPRDPHEQLRGAVEAVFRSWNTRRAKAYREHHGIPHDLGTAVVVQSMVFGNLSDDSGSGVVFTRDPATGDPALYGEFLAASQGEDVVAGIRTPDPLPGAMAPAAFGQLQETCRRLEREQGDVLDIEFTVERARLYFLQVRRAKRTPQAAVRFAVDLLDEGVLDLPAALDSVGLDHVRQIERPGFDPADVEAARTRGDLLATGTGACPGQVSGALALTSERAREVADAGEPVVLARPVTSPTDLEGMIAAQGIVTATGGSTSHAAVVARALGTTCVVGAGDLEIDVAAGTVTVGDRVLAEGDPVSLDGASGEIFAGAFGRAAPAAASDGLRRLLAAGPDPGGQVFARVTLPAQVELVRERGAVGLVTAIDDVLAAGGRLEKFVQTLLRSGRVTDAVCAQLEEAVVAELGPLLQAAAGMDVGVRAIDFLSDDSRELMQQTALLSRFPELSMPIGAPRLVQAQLAAVTRAAEGSGARPHLSVRHLRDPAESDALRTLRASMPGPVVPVGAYLTSPRAVAHLGSILHPDELAWVEVRTVQARMFGIPARQLLTRQPLDDYARRGLLPVDPRTTLDPLVAGLFATAAQLDDGVPHLGARLSGVVSAELVAGLHRLGLRRFAVEVDEIRPTRLALAQAAARG